MHIAALVKIITVYPTESEAVGRLPHEEELT